MIRYKVDLMSCTVSEFVEFLFQEAKTHGVVPECHFSIGLTNLKQKTLVDIYNDACGFLAIENINNLSMFEGHNVVAFVIGEYGGGVFEPMVHSYDYSYDCDLKDSIEYVVDKALKSISFDVDENTFLIVSFK